MSLLHISSFMCQGKYKNIYTSFNVTAGRQLSRWVWSPAFKSGRWGLGERESSEPKLQWNLGQTSLTATGFRAARPEFEGEKQKRGSLETGHRSQGFVRSLRWRRRRGRRRRRRRRTWQAKQWILRSCFESLFLHPKKVKHTIKTTKKSLSVELSLWSFKNKLDGNSVLEEQRYEGSKGLSQQHQLHGKYWNTSNHCTISTMPFREQCEDGWHWHIINYLKVFSCHWLEEWGHSKPASVTLPTFSPWKKAPNACKSCIFLHWWNIGMLSFLMFTTNISLGPSHMVW